MSHAAILFGLLASMGTDATKELFYVEAKAMADRDEASLSPAESDQLVRSQGTAGGTAHANCVTGERKPDLSPYTVVMELDGAGRVTRTWRKGDSPLAKCFDSEMSKQRLFVPPRTPFYTSFEMSWEQH